MSSGICDFNRGKPIFSRLKMFHWSSDLQNHDSINDTSLLAGLSKNIYKIYVSRSNIIAVYGKLKMKIASFLNFKNIKDV